MDLNLEFSSLLLPTTDSIKIKIRAVELKRMLQTFMYIFYLHDLFCVHVLCEEFEIELQFPKPESYFAFVPLETKC